VTESEQRFLAGPRGARILWAALEYAPVGVGICDGDGVFVFVNAALAALLDRPRAAVIGRPFLTFVHPEDRAAALAAYFSSVVAAASRCRLRVPAQRGQLRCLTSTGATIWLAATWTVTAPDSCGEQLAVVHLTDVTARSHGANRQGHR
jgi:PAS domain S-box